MLLNNLFPGFVFGVSMTFFKVLTIVKNYLIQKKKTEKDMQEYYHHHFAPKSELCLLQAEASRLSNKVS